MFDLERVEAFRRASFDAADGGASARVVDRVIVPALAGRPLELRPAAIRPARPGAEPPGVAARM